MEKNCLNPECGQSFEYLNSKALYCSDRCKMAHRRSVKKGLIEEGVVKKGSEIPPPKPKEAKKEKWVLDIEDFCNAQGCTPADLMETFITFKSKPVSKTAAPVAAPAPKAEIKTPEQKARTSEKIVKSVIKTVEPLPGSNAYFLKYGK